MNEEDKTEKKEKELPPLPSPPPKRFISEDVFVRGDNSEKKHSPVPLVVAPEAVVPKGVNSESPLDPLSLFSGKMLSVPGSMTLPSNNEGPEIEGEVLIKSDVRLNDDMPIKVPKELKYKVPPNALEKETDRKIRAARMAGKYAIMITYVNPLDPEELLHYYALEKFSPDGVSRTLKHYEKLMVSKKQVPEKKEEDITIEDWK